MRRPRDGRLATPRSRANQAAFKISDTRWCERFNVTALTKRSSKGRQPADACELHRATRRTKRRQVAAKEDSSGSRASATQPDPFRAAADIPFVATEPHDSRSTLSARDSTLIAFGTLRF